MKKVNIFMAVVLLVTGLLMTGCPATLQVLQFGQTITDKNNNVYEVALEVNNEIYSADFEVTIKDKVYSCGVNFEKNKGAPFSIQTDFSMYELTGSFLIGYKNVVTICGVTNKEEIEKIIRNSLFVQQYIKEFKKAPVIQVPEEVREESGKESEAGEVKVEEETAETEEIKKETEEEIKEETEEEIKEETEKDVEEGK